MISVSDLTQLESDRIERKASATDMKKISRTVCAFANDLPGHDLPGFILIGVNDDGSFAHLPITDELLLRLSQLRSNGKILPVPSIQVYKRETDGHDIAVIEVIPSAAPPVRFAGRVWVRIGPSTQEAERDDERVLTERARYRDQPFDRRPAPSTSLADLDLTFFDDNYLPAAIAPTVLQRNQRSQRERLASLRLMTEDTPTYGAILTMGVQPRDVVPGAYLQFLRIDGDELGDPIRNEHTLEGPLHSMMAELDALLSLHISTAVDFTAGPTELRSPDYPLPALQQLARNALIHRNYETNNAPVRIYWFNDRIEIHSPGGLYGQVTEQNLGRGTTDYRNPLVAEAMAHLGYVQRFGFGIPTSKKQLANNKNPPLEHELSSQSTLFLVRKR